MLIENVHAVLKATADGVIFERINELVPAVPIKKSVTPDYIISLEEAGAPEADAQETAAGDFCVSTFRWLGA